MIVRGNGHPANHFCVLPTRCRRAPSRPCLMAKEDTSSLQAIFFTDPSTCTEYLLVFVVNVVKYPEGLQ